jgi:hypothetical protein
MKYEYVVVPKARYKSSTNYDQNVAFYYSALFTFTT